MISVASRNDRFGDLAVTVCRMWGRGVVRSKVSGGCDGDVLLHGEGEGDKF